MTTAMTLFDTLGVADTSALPRSAAAVMLDNVGNDFKRISIKAGVFRLIAGGKEVATKDERYMDVVFVNAAPSIHRSFFGVKYEEGAKVAPKCWSSDGINPAAEVPVPQSKACMTCPQNIKGSGDNNTRACRFSQRVAVVLENDLSGDVFGMSLPATTVWGENTAKGLPLSNYNEQLKLRKTDPGHIVTRMTFDTNASSPKLVFAPVRRLTASEIDKAIEQGNSEAAKQAVTLTVHIDEEEAIVEGVMGALEAPKTDAPAPTKAETAATITAPAEPAVRAAAVKVPPTGNVQELIKAWGTDD